VLVDIAFKFRLYPAREQAALLAKTFGCKRFVWNEMLEERIDYYHDHGTSAGKARKTEKEWKVIYPFLKEVDSIALQQARIDLDTAYDRFFKHLGRFPRFKSRKGKQSYRTQYTGGNIAVDFAARKLKLPKLGLVAYRDDRSFPEVPRNVTVSKTKSGKYFAAILVQREIDVAKKTTIDARDVAGFDAGAAGFITSELARVQNPRFYRSQQTKIARYHRAVSKKTKGSHNRDRARVKLARLYDKIGNRRRDWMHRLSTELANRHDAVFIEDLNVDGMKRFGVAKSFTLDASWGAFVAMLSYKMDRRGKHLVKVGRFYPSSKTCSVCGFINHALTLDDRAWSCPSCGARHDRDTNAAINITREGIRLLRAESITVINIDTTVGTTGSHARGDPARPAITAARVVEPGIPRL
jgi:putative transposase